MPIQTPAMERAAKLSEMAYLQHFWQRQTQRKNASADQYLMDRLFCFALGVGIEQVMRVLAEPSTFEQFCAWLIETGELDAINLQRLQAKLEGKEPELAAQEFLAKIDAMQDVLSSDDLRHWQQHGYVIVPKVISAEECGACSELVFANVRAEPDKPETWYGYDNRQGIMVQKFQAPALEAARRSPRMHKAMAQLWGSADLFVTIDRCGFNPPERADYAFPGPHLHWDCELRPQLPFATQAILYLTDTVAEQGAFSCVPGFQHELDDFLANLPEGANPQEHIPQDRAMPIPGKAGDLIIWHQALPHGSSPNRSNKPRVVQYVNMLAAPTGLVRLP